MNSLQTNRMALHLLKTQHGDASLVLVHWMHWTNGKRTGCQDCKPGWVHRYECCSVCGERWNREHAKEEDIETSDDHRRLWAVKDLRYQEKMEREANKAKSA